MKFTSGLCDMQSIETREVLRISLGDSLDFEEEVLIQFHLYPELPECTIPPYEPSEPQRAVIQSILMGSTDVLPLLPSERVQELEGMLEEGCYE